MLEESYLLEGMKCPIWCLREREVSNSMTVEDNDFFIEIVSVRSIVIRSKPSHNWSCGRDERLIRRRIFELTNP